MKETAGNIWSYYGRDSWVIIPTNGFVKRNGECVCGKGLALQAAQKFPQFPMRLGSMIKNYGNHVFHFPDLRLISFPVKHAWYNKTADLRLINRSAAELQAFPADIIDEAYLPCVGCGNGRLSWLTVGEILAKKLDNRFTVILI